MSGTPIVDLSRWRAERSQDAGLVASPAAATDPLSAAICAAVDQDEHDAAVIRLPDVSAARGRSAGPGPASVFGPVMAFGLARRPETPRPAAIGDEATNLTPKTRPRSRHLSDARGATRGPGR